MKTLLKKLSLLAIACCLFFNLPMAVYANDLDGLTESSSDNTGAEGSYGSYNSGLREYLHGYTPVTDENIKSASTVASPIVNVVGNLIGFIVIVVASFIMLITALDLLYIGVPPVRPHLNPNYASGGAQPMGGMPMGGMGMGMRGGMMGGMGGGAQAQPTGRHCWVSDEAIACTDLLGQQGGAQPMGGGMPSMGGMGMGMGMMGGGMMGAQPQPQMSTKSVILTYFKKRVFFIVFFTIAMITLTSSIFTDCGINLAELVFKVMEKVNSAISGVSI